MKRKQAQSIEPVAAAPEDGWQKAALAVLLLFFLCRISSWTFGEFWYDETLSLTHFVLGRPSPWGIFRTYPIANNHMLSNAIEWCWLAAGGGGPGFTEALVRVPALAVSIATLLVIGVGWRRLLGRPCALLAAALMAASPLFGGFAWQMRGYALAIALSTALVTLGAARLQRMTARNAFGGFVLSLLLPLTMPSAAMLPCTVILALAVCAWQAKVGFRHAIRLVWPMAAGVFLGIGYYGTLWRSFVYASHEAGGWPSFWMTLGGIAVPFLLHVLAALALCALPSKGEARGDLAPSVGSYAAALAAASGVALLAILLLRLPEGRFPFPRVFLPLLPAATFSAAALLMRLKGASLAQRRRWLAALAAIVLFGTLLGVAADRWNEHSLRQGGTRQNLLAQYYRGMDDNQRLAGYLVENYMRKEGKPFLLIVPSMDAPTAQFYLAMYQGDIDIWCAVSAPERLQAPLVQEALRRHARLFVSARNADEADALLAAYAALCPDAAVGKLEVDFATGFRQLWTPVP